MPIDENQVKDDQTTGAGSNLGSPPNAAQESQLKKTQGTESKNSANNAGDGNAQSNANTANTDAPGRRLKYQHTVIRNRGNRWCRSISYCPIRWNQ